MPHASNDSCYIASDDHFHWNRIRRKIKLELCPVHFSAKRSVRSQHHDRACPSTNSSGTQHARTSRPEPLHSAAGSHSVCMRAAIVLRRQAQRGPFKRTCSCHWVWGGLPAPWLHTATAAATADLTRALLGPLAAENSSKYRR